MNYAEFCRASKQFRLEARSPAWQRHVASVFESNATRVNVEYSGIGLSTACFSVGLFASLIGKRNIILVYPKEAQAKRMLKVFESLVLEHLHLLEGVRFSNDGDGCCVQAFGIATSVKRVLFPKCKSKAELVRPDLVIVDDPFSDARGSATEESRIRDRLNTIWTQLGPALVVKR